METLYVTADLLKNTLSLNGTNFADVDLAMLATTASRTVDNLCNRHFYVDDDANQVRYYTPDELAGQDIDDLTTLTSFQTDSDGDGSFDQTWTLNSDFILEDINAQADPADLWPYVRLTVHPLGQYTLPVSYPRSVKVTGKFGWPVVPDAIVTATILVATLLLTVQRSAPLGIVAFDGGAIRLARGNPQVMMLVAPYEHHRRVAVA